MAAHSFMRVRFYEEPFQLLECFTALMYNKASEQQHANKARKKLFSFQHIMMKNYSSWSNWHIELECIAIVNKVYHVYLLKRVQDGLSRKTLTH